MSLIPIYWWNKEVHSFRISQQKFSKQPWANGVVLMACVLVAMLLAVNLRRIAKEREYEIQNRKVKMKK